MVFCILNLREMNKYYYYYEYPVVVSPEDFSNLKEDKLYEVKLKNLLNGYHHQK